jgi:peptidyl-prolyl cis-trans isomerase SurA
VANNFRKQLKKGKKSVDEIMTEINKTNTNGVTKRDGKYAHGENEVIEKTGWKTGLSENIKFLSQTYIVDMHKILPVTPKSLEETKGAITADFQTYLEKEWISSLRNKYPVQINNDILQSIWKK